MLASRSELVGRTGSTACQRAVATLCNAPGALVELAPGDVGIAVQQAFGTLRATGLAVSVIASELTPPVSTALARTVGALAVAVGVFTTRDVTGRSAAIERARRALATATTPIGARATTCRRIGAIDVARWGVTTEVANTMAAARTLSVCASAAALVVVATAFDVTRRSLALEPAIRTFQTDARLVATVGFVGARRRDE